MSDDNVADRHADPNPLGLLRNHAVGLPHFRLMGGTKQS